MCIEKRGLYGPMIFGGIFFRIELLVKKKIEKGLGGGAGAFVLGLGLLSACAWGLVEAAWGYTLA